MTERPERLKNVPNTKRSNIAFWLSLVTHLSGVIIPYFLASHILRQRVSHLRERHTGEALNEAA